MKLIRKLRRDDEGIIAVEAAFVVPVLVVLVLGAVEFGRILFAHQVLTQSTRDAARYLARTANPANAAVAGSMVRTGSPDTGAPLLVKWGDASHVNVQVNQTNIDNPTDADGETPYRGGATIRVITVQTTATYDAFFGLLNKITGSDTLSFNIQRAERVIGE